MSEALADVREGFSKKEIKMAIGVASDPRYKQGNYTGAVNAIEKIKKGLSKHPQVAAVLKRQNEEVELDEVTMSKALDIDPKDVNRMKTLAILYTRAMKLPAGSPKQDKFKKEIEKLRKELGMSESVFKELVKSVELDEKVKEYKGVAYFKTRKDAEEHMKKFAPKGRVVEFGRGYAVQTKISGPYLNKSGKTEEVELDEKLDKEDEPKVKEIIKKLKGASQAHAGQAQDLQKAIDEGKMKQFHMMQKDGASAEQIAKALKLDLKTVKALMKEEVELDELKEPFAVVDTADGDKVVGTASSEKGAKEIITTAQLPPMKIKDKKTLKIVKVKKKQNIGYPLKEGTWAVPETPAQKRDLKRLMSKPLPLGKEGDNAANKMYSIIGDDVLFDDLYVAGKKDPEGDARPIIKKAMKRLKIKEDRWFERDTWRLDESTKPDHIKVFNSLKKGDKVEINYDSSMAGGSTKTFVIRTKNKVYKGKVDKVTMYPDGKTGGVKFHLYQYDNRPGVYMAIGDMGASLRDIKKL